VLLTSQALEFGILFYEAYKEFAHESGNRAVLLSGADAGLVVELGVQGNRYIFHSFTISQSYVCVKTEALRLRIFSTPTSSF